MRKNLKKLFSVAAFCLAIYGFGQEKTIKGQVLDADGFPVHEAYVYIEGETDGVYTDENGNYTINADKGDKILVEYVFTEIQNQIVGEANTYNFKLAAKGEITLDAVVTTALGIDREAKALGYAVSTISSEDLVVAKDANLLNNLAGKAAGINVTQQSGTVGGSSKIILRGATSMTGDNQPLFVVDGMPISNNYKGAGIEGTVDYGSPISDINPNDVEDINILKGAAATALYGARAKNGAIIITTKKGKKGRMNVSFSSNIRVNEVAKLPDYQNEYAQGVAGDYSIDNFNGWGPKISDVSGQKFKDFLEDDVTLTAFPENVKNFFDTGISKINSLAISGGNTNGDFRLGYTNTRETGVVPQSEFKNDNITFNAGQKLSDRLSMRASGSYSRSKRDGLSPQGSNDANIVVANILTMPRTTNIDKLRNNVYNELGNQNFWDGKKTNNPFYILDNNKITSDVERFYGNASVELKLTDWLSVQNKTGIDFSTDARRVIYSKGTAGEIDGKFSDVSYRGRVFNNDFMLTGKTSITDKITANFIVGHNAYQSELDIKRNISKQLIAKGLYTYANAKVNTPSNYYSIKRIHGVYGEISMDYDKIIYLTVTGRNDWTSTLPKGNNSYFYPSVSLSYLFSENIKSNWLEFGKLRLNWANVGSDEDPYLDKFTYSATNTWFSQYGAGGTFPFGGVSGFSIPRTFPNVDLKPQNQVSYEVGVELQMFKNRVSFDGSFYYIDTKDQILRIDVPLSTGYFAKQINAGLVRNIGFEFQLGVTPVQTKDWNWNFNVNFSQNKSTVEELDGKLKNYTLTSGWSGLQVKATPGESFSIFGTGWKRTDDGQYVINSKTGLREVVTGQNLGSIDPDFRLGFVNTVSYKNLSLTAVLDWKQGGKMYSGTVARLRATGLVEETLAHRGTSFIEKGVNEVVDASGNVSYVENNTAVDSMEKYWGHIAAVSNTEGNIFDATYIKLRAVSLKYDFPKKFFKTSIVKGISVGVEGRNLWNIIDNVPHIDPELNFFGPSATGGGVEYNSIPLTRSYGMSLNVNF